MTIPYCPIHLCPLKRDIGVRWFCEKCEEEADERNREKSWQEAYEAAE